MVKQVSRRVSHIEIALKKSFPTERFQVISVLFMCSYDLAG